MRLRQQLSGGFGRREDTIAWHLEHHHQIRVSRNDRPHPATSGPRHPGTAQAARSSYVRFVAEQPNECWQSTHSLPPGRRRRRRNLVVVGRPRPLRRVDHCPQSVTGPIVVETFQAAIALHGPPASTLTDNGMVFTTRLSGGGGRNGFETELVRLGIVQKNSRPNHPGTCGKIERFQQTLKTWLRPHPSSPPPSSTQPSWTCRRTTTPSAPTARATTRHPRGHTTRPKAAPDHRRGHTHYEPPRPRRQDRRVTRATTDTAPHRPRRRTRPNPNASIVTSTYAHRRAHRERSATSPSIPRDYQRRKERRGTAPPAGFEPATRGLEGLQHSALCSTASSHVSPERHDASYPLFRLRSAEKERAHASRAHIGEDVQNDAAAALAAGLVASHQILRSDDMAEYPASDPGLTP